MSTLCPGREGPCPEFPRLLQALERCRSQLEEILASFHVPKQDAEDLLQDLLVLAIKKLPEIETLDLWLPATTRNLCIIHFRKQRRRREVLAAYEPPCPPERPALDLTLDLAAALAVLPPELRRFVVLRVMDFSPLEIAGRTGYHPESVRKVVRRGMVRLAETLNRGTMLGRPPFHPQPSPASLAAVLAASYTSPRTRQYNLSHLRSFAGWMGFEDTEAALEKLLSVGQEAAEELVSRYRRAMLESGLAARTVNNRISVLRVTVRLAARHGLVEWQLRGCR